jgi:hypothetical protein
MIGRVHRAGAQLPRQPGVDGAEAQLAGRGARHVVALAQDPLELGGRGQRVGEDALVEQLIDALHRARVLPDDGRIDRQAGLALPHQGRGALGGDADRGQVVRPHTRATQRVADDAPRRLPDVQRVLLHPPGARVRRGDLFVRGADQHALLVEDHGADAGGAFVDGEDVHGASVVTALSTQW